MEQVDSNWKYNVSKKIAQLTKVVYRLHTEGLDRRDAIAKLKKKHDKEIEDLREDALHQHEAYKEEAEKHKIQQEKAIKDTYENKLLEIKEQYDNEKIKMEKQAKSIANLGVSQIDELQKQIRVIQGQLNTARDGFNQTTKQIIEQFETTIKTLRKKHENELSELVTESNNKYNNLLVESAKKEDELKAQFKKAQEEFSKQNGRVMQEQLEIAQNKLKDTKEKLDAALSDNKEIIAQNKVITKKNKQMEKENLDLRYQLDTIQEKAKRADEGELQKLREKLKDEEDKRLNEVTRLNEQLFQLKSQYLLELDNQAKEFEKIKRQLQTTITELEAKIRVNQNLSNDKIFQINREHKQKLEEIEKHQEQEIAKYKAKETENLKRIFDLEQKVEELQKGIEFAVEKERQQHSNDISLLIRSHVDEIDSLKSEVEKLKAERETDVKSTIENYETKISALQKQLEDTLKELQDLKTEFELERMKIQQDREADVLKLKHDFEASKQAMLSNFEQKLKALSLQHQNENDSKEKMYEAALRQAEEKYELNLRLQAEEITKELDRKKTIELENQRDLYENEVKAIQEKLNAKQIDMLELEKKNRVDMKEYEDQILSLKKRIEELERVIQDNKESYMKLLNANSNDMKELMKQHDTEAQLLMQKLVANHEEDMNNQRIGFNKSLTAKNQEIANLKKEYEKAISELKDRVQSLCDEMDSLKEAHSHENNSNLTKIAQLQKRIEELQNDAEFASLERIKSIEGAMEDIKRRHAFDIENYKKQIEGYEREKINNAADLAKKLAAKDNECELRLQELSLEKNGEISALRSQFSEQLSALQSALDEANSKLAESSYRLRAEADAKISASKEEYDLQKKRWEREREETLDKHKKEVGELKKKIEELEKSIQDQIEKYNARGSRPEDTEKIGTLEKQLTDRTEMLTKLFNELKHYQHELANREATYNKVFTNKPQVAVLNVIERRIKRDQSIESTTGRKLPPLAEQIEKAERAERRRAATSLSARRERKSKSAK